MKKIRIAILLLFLFFAGIQNLFAQCAICSAVAQDGLNNGQTISSGLNHGIIYLAIFPYFIIVLAGYFIYKYIKKADTE